MIELLLALGLIGLIASLALPRVMPNAGAAGLRFKAFEIAAMLRSDRDAALRTGQAIATSVDLASRRVRSGVTGGTVLIPDNLSLRLTGPLSNGFHFAADGSSSGGQLTIAHRNTAVSVQVNRVTAAVTVVSR
jgi:general secretion pathway protein H